LHALGSSGGLAVHPLRFRLLCSGSRFISAAMPEVVSLVKGPKEAYEAMADKGAELCKKSLGKVFHQSFYAGCYIGFGGMLSMVVAGGVANAAENDPGIQTFVFAALFPVNLLLILLTGGVLITGAAAIVPAAVLEGKADWKNIPKIWTVAWIGNLLGSLVFAFLVHYCDMNTGGTATLAVNIALRKCKKNFLIVFIKGVGCNWMVCMAVYLSGQAQDMVGKMVGIWFPISCFVAIGFEHIPANMFMIPLGILAGADVSVGEMIYKNFIPTTLGNIFAGAVIVAVGYSFAFGKLGTNEQSGQMSASNRASREFNKSIDMESGTTKDTTGLDNIINEQVTGA
jgi:formate transporter